MLPFRNLARRSLSCSSSLLRKCKPPKDSDPCKCQPPKEGEACEPATPKKMKGAGRQCPSDGGKHGAPGPSRDMGIPDFCCKENALECARKLQELQKQWEAVAAACNPGERAGPKTKRPGCPVEPPAREGGGISPIVLMLAGVALVAAIVWWVINNKDEPPNGDAPKEENKDAGTTS